MNVQSKIDKTAAEEALSEQFLNSLGSLPGSPNVVQGRDKMFAALLKDGLPTRRVEAWHYTDLRRLLNSVPAGQADGHVAAEAGLVENAKVLSILNGQIADDFGTLPEGVSVSSFKDALADGSADLHFADTEADDAIGQLNGAFVSDGYKIDVAADAKVEAPIEIQFVQAAGQSHSRLPVAFGENSNATIIERHIASGEDEALVSSVGHISVGKGAHARWIIVQEQNVQSTHLGQVNIDLAEDAKLELYLVNAGGKLVRQEIVADVQGSGADLVLRGVNLLAGSTHTDVTLKLGHNVPHTTSDETFRNVVFDKAKGVFQGQIKVAQIAQKTDAQMACNTLLLSDDADFSAKPELEIFADDVICAHGATVADIDPAHLFYLMARGITEKSARGLLVKGFVAEVVEDLEDEAIVEALENIISEWLQKNG
ncbi:MAG: Fe-S cluster assembly protein SufD [Lentilitoribacter sp.]